MHLASGPVTPAKAAFSARAARAAFERGLNVDALTKFAVVLEGKMLNGDLQAGRMYMEYCGLMKKLREEQEEDSDRPQQNITQINIETDDRPRTVRLGSLKTSNEG